MNQKFHRLIFSRIDFAFPNPLLQGLHCNCLLFMNFRRLFQWFVFQLQSLNHLSQLFNLGAQSFLLFRFLLLQICPHHRRAGVLLNYLICRNCSLQLTYNSTLILQILCEFVHFLLSSTEPDLVLSFILLDQVLQKSDWLSQVVNLVLNRLRVVLLPRPWWTLVSSCSLR